jgi:SP family sugar:H+ symporter-like MFS transporter
MVTFAGCIPALWLIERLGRRKMLLIGGAGEVVCAIIAGLCGHFLLAPSGTPDDQLTSSNIRGGQLLVSFAIIQVLFFATFWGELHVFARRSTLTISLGPTPWVITGEIFPLHVRAQGVAAATATNWLWSEYLVTAMLYRD